MNQNELDILHFVHVSGVLALIAYTFYGFAAATETKKRVLMITGIATLLVLGTGLRMWQAKYGFAPAPWLLVKLVCWLALSALSGIGYRKRESAPALMLVVLGLAVVAVAMAFLKP